MSGRVSEGEVWLRGKSEAAFQVEVLGAAGWFGWLRFHDHDSRRDGEAAGVDPGFPDCVLLHPVSGRCVVMELKSEGGRLEVGQKRWLDAWEGVAGVEVYRGLRPRDMDRILGILR